MLESSDTRKIYLSGEITKELVDDTIFTINRINYEDILALEDCESYKITPIKLYINSQGGNVIDSFGLVFFIENSVAPVYTYNLYACESSAFLIYLAGTKRFFFEYSRFMFHGASAGIDGKIAEMQDYLKVLKKTNENLINYTQKKCDIPIQKLKNTINKKTDFVIFGKDCLKYNLGELLV